MMETTKKTDNSILIRSINTDAGEAALHISIYSTEGLSINEHDDYSYGGLQIQRHINRE